jgi:heme/copper-type cytochrome/quinol oxidase subunit 3
MWPPLGIETISAFGLPLLNTVLLISSGISLTYAHIEILNKNYSSATKGLSITLLYSFLFTSIQIFEYVNAPFSINDSVYGSIFFFCTGFHGLHVFIGSIMLLICLIRNELRQMSADEHVGFLCSA